MITANPRMIIFLKNWGRRIFQNAGNTKHFETQLDKFAHLNLCQGITDKLKAQAIGVSLLIIPH